MARAAAARGTAMGLSSFASKPVEEVVAANPQTFFQIYWCGSRDQIAARLERARAAGAVGPDPDRRTGRSRTPATGAARRSRSGSDLRPTLRHAPEALRPAALAGPVRADRPAAGADRARTWPSRASEPPTFFGAYGRVDADAAAQLGRRGLAARAVGRARSCSRASAGSTTPSARSTPGVTAISVSNHGGNNLDGTPATIRCLPAVADAVGGQVEVLLDGGVRRGSDVVKALALGRARGHDRPGLPVGPGRERAGRRRERAGHFRGTGSIRRCSGSASPRCTNWAARTC